MSAEIPSRLTGAGRSVEERLAARRAPCARMKDALDEIFLAAKGNGVGILIDAERNYVQAGIDSWALQAQEHYNHGKAVIFNTYQAYLQSAPVILAQHLAFAREKGFVLGVKLVRGAYFGTDPHNIFWSSKADTDRVYDGIAEALIRRNYNHILTPLPQQGFEKKGPTLQFPEISILFGTHNHNSVRNAVKIWNEERKSSTNRVDVAFGQLMGMADEVSGELIVTGRNDWDGDLRTYKYLPWGTVGECLGYLTRRADENRQAVQRAREGRRAMSMELRRRVMGRWLSWKTNWTPTNMHTYVHVHTLWTEPLSPPSIWTHLFDPFLTLNSYLALEAEVLEFKIRTSKQDNDRLETRRNKIETRLRPLLWSSTVGRCTYVRYVYVCNLLYVQVHTYGSWD